MRETVLLKKINGKFDQLIIENKVFDQLIVRNSKFFDSKFYNVHFKHSSIGIKSSYTNCDFVKCKFWGTNSHFGGPCVFTNCNFLDCNIRGNYILTNVTFINCTFRGKFINTILYSKTIKQPFGPILFNNCDLSELGFENVSIKGSEIFNNCRLPKKSVRYFQNNNNELLEKSIKFCASNSSQIALVSSILFDKELSINQNPIMFDDTLLSTIFDSEESRNLFERIVDGFEII